MAIQTNIYQTQLTDEYLSMLSEEEHSTLMDYISSVPFIQRLISPDRKYAKDLARDEKGRIIIDLCNPHICEDMEYFRPAGNHWREHGCYTFLRPNRNPNSDFGKWLKREIERCWYGMVRPSDGEWVTGDMYFYLNYFPIIQSKIGKNLKQATRIVDLPEPWEGVYWRFHYWDQAKNGGIYNNFVGGQHGGEIARRGASKSYAAAAKATRYFLLGENAESNKKIKVLVAAYGKEYLNKDGILNKFVDGLTHCAEHTQFPSAMLQNSWSEMKWKAGYKDQIMDIDKGSLNELLGASAVDNIDVLRGKRASLLINEEFGAFPKFLDFYQVNLANVQEQETAFGQSLQFGTGGCVCAGTKLWATDGTLLDVKHFIENQLLNRDPQFYGWYNWCNKYQVLGYNGTELSCEATTPFGINKKQCYKITLNSGKELCCSDDHPILTEDGWVETQDLTIKDKVCVVDKVAIFGKENYDDARLIGWLVADGSYGEKQSVRLFNCEHEINTFLEKNYNISRSKSDSYMTGDGKMYHVTYLKGFRDTLRKLGIYGQTKNKKRLPEAVWGWNKQSVADFIGGLFDCDGYVRLRRQGNSWSMEISIVQSHKEILQEIDMLLSKFGIHGTIRKRSKKGKDDSEWYEYDICDAISCNRFANEIFLFPKVKRERLSYIRHISKTIKSNVVKNGRRLEKIKSIEDIGWQYVYNFTAHNTNTYIANNIITHNSEGTDFSGALEMIYHPSAYNIYALPNVWDRGSGGGGESLFIFPQYVNAKGFYNKDGVSDVIGALMSEIRLRINLRNKSTDPIQVTRRKAEYGITIQEMIMKRDGTIFPVADITDRLNELDGSSNSFSDVYTGRLGVINDKVTYIVDSSKEPIMKYPLEDKTEGGIQIFQMPVRDSDGRVPRGRYIAGLDTYDDDHSNTNSLGSLFILDLLTDEIVFEYTGRPMFADDFYEIARLALLFYNAECNYENNKKGLFGYFARHHCLHLLSDTLEILKDKEMIKGNMLGNKSKGTMSTEPIKKYGRRLLRDYLLTPIHEIDVTEVNGEIVETETVIKKLSKMKQRALLQELTLWNPDGNFDRVDAMNMLMLLREDKLKIIGDGTIEDSIEDTSASYEGNDSYFKRHYDNRFERFSN